MKKIPIIDAPIIVITTIIMNMIISLLLNRLQIVVGVRVTSSSLVARSRSITFFQSSEVLGNKQTKNNIKDELKPETVFSTREKWIIKRITLTHTYINKPLILIQFYNEGKRGKEKREKNEKYIIIAIIKTNNTQTKNPVVNRKNYPHFFRTKMMSFSGGFSSQVLLYIILN